MPPDIANVASAAGAPAHSTSVQAVVGCLLIKLSVYVKSLDYVLLGDITSILALLYLVFVFSLAIERRVRRRRLVNKKDFAEFTAWKARREVENDAP